MQKNTSFMAIFFVLLMISSVFLFSTMFSKLFNEQESSAQYQQNPNAARVGVVEINGIIESSDAVLRQLLLFDKRKDIDFIALRLDTPGGAVAPSQEIYDTVRGLKKNVVVSMGNVAASGGYYIASAADLVCASRGTITGSIGVISSFADLSELYSFLKFKPWEIKSGKFKDAGTPARAPTEEEKAYLQTLVMELHDQFVSDVAQARNLNPDDVRKHADGRVFSGAKALELKFIDKLGNFDAAMKAATQKWVSGKEDYMLIYPEKERDFFKILDLISEKGETAMHRISMQNGFYYLSREAL